MLTGRQIHSRISTGARGVDRHRGSHIHAIHLELDGSTGQNRTLGRTDQGREGHTFANRWTGV